jgi:hypothetical protein
MGLLLITALAKADTPPTPAPLGFEIPSYTDSEARNVLQKYGYVDPDRQVPDDLLKTALLYFNFNEARIANRSVLSVVDFSQHSSVARWYFIDMKTGKVTARHTSHGIGSDPSSKKYPHGTGYARKFSNTPNSNMSSIGFFLASDTYNGDHGLSVHLEGLSTTNSNARERAIVVHRADYVIEENKLQGRSDGCFAIAPSEHDAVVSLIAGGSLLYADRSKK